VKTSRVIFALSRADFLERVRRYSFFLTLLFAVLLGYAAATGKIYIRLGEFRGVYTSAWIGTMVAMVTTCFVSLVGFYVVKNAIERDRQTGVGQILASTSLSNPSYMLGKFLSNFAVLSSMVLVLALSAVVMWFFAAEDPRFELWALLSPFLFLALPVMALVAALALFFEALPVLGGGVGNVLWFFAWSMGIALPEITRRPWFDPMGVMTVGNQIMAAARGAIPGYTSGFSLTIDFETVKVASSLHYQGVHWTPAAILARLLWVAVAVALSLLAALFFNRFDPSRGRFSPAPTSRTSLPAVAASLPASAPAFSARPAPAHLTPLAARAHTSAFGRIFAAELRLAFKGVRWWWFTGASGLLVAQFLTPLEISRGPVLGTAWLWPILLWSAMGTRESQFAVEPLLFSAPRLLPRQLLACFLAGFAIAFCTGAGALLRLLLAGQFMGLCAWLAGALFLPALALGLGVISGTSKAFEALLAVLWYIGPMNRMPGFDFTGAASGPRAPGYTLMYALLSAALFLAAYFARSRRLRRN
jgi:hypothetical protein